MRLPSCRKSYWTGSPANRHMPNPEASTSSSETAETQPVCRVSEAAYGPATQALMRDGFFSRSGRTRSARTIKGGMKAYVATQQSSMPMRPMKPNWLKPRKLTAPSDP